MLTNCPLGKKETHACWECLFNGHRESNIAFNAQGKKCTHPDYNKETNTSGSQIESTGGLYGWICPKCGAVMGPFQSYCIKCSGSWEFTWGTGTSYNTPMNSECNGGNE